MAILQGESLLNDAVALLAFGIAVSAATTPGASLAPLMPPLLIAVPGGILVGVLVGVLGTRLMQRVAGTLSAIIAQFLLTFGTWILAAHLDFSPILAVVALAAVAAREMPKRTSARDRINSNAVWSTVTFILNVLAFLLMGLQARAIVTGMRDEALTRALAFAGLVLAAVILVRFAWVMAYGFAIRRFRRYFEKRTARGTVPACAGRHPRLLVRHAGTRDARHRACAAARIPPPRRDRTERIHRRAGHAGAAGLHDSPAHRLASHRQGRLVRRGDRRDSKGHADCGARVLEGEARSLPPTGCAPNWRPRAMPASIALDRTGHRTRCGAPPSGPSGPC